MLGLVSRRFFHSCRVQFSNGKSSSLGKLRKSTGYSISNCKKALELFPDDVSKAEEWLHAEAKQQGWSKWAKIQKRSASQGLVGVFSRDKIGVMVEVNCETDFVARNIEFQQLVENILYGCINHIADRTTTEDLTKTYLDEAQLSQIKHNSSTLGEFVNAAISKFGEKTVLKRAICLKVKEDIDLSSLSHPAVLCPNLAGATLGKYGTILASKKSKAESIHDKELCLNICQHIIGMNPLAVGQLTEEDIQNFQKERIPEDIIEVKNPENQNMQSAKVSETPTDENDCETEGQDTVNADGKDSDDTRLLFQPFLLDPNVSVGETLFKSGIEIINFERFECGETLSEGVEAKQSASATN